MDFRMMTYNARGLTAPRSRVKLRNFLLNLPYKLDILCIHEHKSRVNCTKYLQAIWKDAEFFIAPALDGRHARRNRRVRAGKGGTLLAIGPRLKSCVTLNGSLPSGKAVWTHIEHPELGRIGVVAIYAPNNKDARAALWSELSETLDPSRPWVFAGDYNMIERPQDRKGGSGKLVEGPEKQKWLHLKRKFCLEDTFLPAYGFLNYSWDSKKKKRHNPVVQSTCPIKERKLRRIDRIYITSSSRKKLNFTLSSQILPGFNLSDHAPVLGTCCIKGKKVRSVTYRMNIEHLEDLDLIDALLKFWREEREKLTQLNGDAATIFFKGLHGSKQITREFGKAKAKEKKLYETTIRAELQRTQLQLEVDPNSELFQQELAEAEGKVNEFTERQAQWSEESSQRHWASQGDKCSKAFFAAFKKQIVSKEIAELMGEDGIIYTGWEDLERITLQHFSKLFGVDHAVSEEAMLAALEPLTEQITQAERLAMEAPLTLDELHQAAKLMARRKVPGPDGIPIEFYLALWEEVGPALLNLLQDGFEKKVIHKLLVRGTIVLLHKKGADFLLDNKRPLTMLNCALKICTKAYQLRLSSVLQRLISENQSAFLPGRNIHHSLMLTDEALHRASISPKAYILLKVDIIKAFDSLDWSFLDRILLKLGFGPAFRNVVQALHAEASSAIVIRGRLTKPFQLARSVRQGDPLSPLLFLLAGQVLQTILTAANLEGKFRGVPIQEIQRDYFLGQFADDNKVLVEARRQYLKEIFRLFDLFAQASGLRIKKAGIKAVYIGEGEIPTDLLDLGLVWETEENFSKILGLHIGKGISPQLMCSYLSQTLENRLTRARRNPLSLMARVTIANNLIMGSLWFMLQLWVGDEKQLKIWEKCICEFIWDGKEGKYRPRVAFELICLPKSRGGLGLIHLSKQTAALAAKIIIWALSSGTHTLQIIIRGKIKELSTRKWGLNDYSWIWNPCSTMPRESSTVWKNICSAWNSIKKNLAPAVPSNRLDRRNSPLWTPHTVTINMKKTGCHQIKQKLLLNEGIITLGDISNREGKLIPWEDRADLPRKCKSAYIKLLGNTKADLTLSQQRRTRISIFVVESGPIDGNFIWEFKILRSERATSYLMGNVLKEHSAAYRFKVGRIFRTSAPPPPQFTLLHRIMIGPPMNSGSAGPHRNYLGYPTDPCGKAELYQWKNGRDFFNVDTRQLRFLQGETKYQLAHNSIKKWRAQENWDPNPRQLWKATWVPFREAKVNGFLWQIIYRAAATNHWLAPKAPPTDESTWCKRCNTNSIEDLTHCLWDCNESQVVWRWITILTRGMTLVPASPIHLEVRHALLGDEIEAEYHPPKKWWALLRAVTCWQLWKARNEVTIQHKSSSIQALKARIWQHVRMHLTKEWKAAVRKGRKKTTPEIYARVNFCRDFGANRRVFDFKEGHLHIAASPPIDILDRNFRFDPG